VNARLPQPPLDPKRPSGATGSLADSVEARLKVVSIAGQDALSERLTAAGLWPGAVIERLARAPFGGPLLFRVHGYRLALRKSEAARVQVTTEPGATE